MALAKPKKLYLICRSATNRPAMLRIFGSLLQIHPDIHRHGSFQALVYKTLEGQWDISNRSVKGS